jgi:uncharacterized protein (DUF2164 family)
MSESGQQKPRVEKSMPIIEFSKEEKAVIVQKVRDYFESELSQEIGQFDAEFLLDFFSAKIGVYFYNRGLSDARAVVANRLDSITEAIYEIEKPSEFAG